VLFVINVAANVISVCHWQLRLVVGRSSCCSRVQATIYLRGGELDVSLIIINIEINSIN